MFQEMLQVGSGGDSVEWDTKNPTVLISGEQTSDTTITYSPPKKGVIFYEITSNNDNGVFYIKESVFNTNLCYRIWSSNNPGIKYKGMAEVDVGITYTIPKIIASSGASTMEVTYYPYKD